MWAHKNREKIISLQKKTQPTAPEKGDGIYWNIKAMLLFTSRLARRDVAPTSNYIADGNYDFLPQLIGSRARRMSLRTH